MPFQKRSWNTKNLEPDSIASASVAASAVRRPDVWSLTYDSLLSCLWYHVLHLTYRFKIICEFLNKKSTRGKISLNTTRAIKTSSIPPFPWVIYECASCGLSFISKKSKTWSKRLLRLYSMQTYAHTHAHTHTYTHTHTHTHTCQSLLSLPAPSESISLSNKAESGQALTVVGRGRMRAFSSVPPFHKNLATGSPPRVAHFSFKACWERGDLVWE